MRRRDARRNSGSVHLAKVFGNWIARGILADETIADESPMCADCAQLAAPLRCPKWDIRLTLK